jgi:hypothetical protein
MIMIDWMSVLFGIGGPRAGKLTCVIGMGAAGASPEEAVAACPRGAAG